MNDTTTKEDGYLAQALEWLNAPRDVLTAQQAAEQEAAWMDATLDAAGFFALEHVTPVQAAMLLCRFSPHDSAESDAESCATDCTSPDDFKRLRLTFASIDQNRPARRSLLDWMDIAAGAGRTIHPWAQRYAKHRGLYDQPRPEPTPVERPLNEAPTPAPAPIESALNAQTTPDDPARRLSLLRELGGSAKQRSGEWRFTGIASLVASEKAQGRSRSDEKTIRADLKEAVQNELEAKRAGFGSGLGQR